MKFLFKASNNIFCMNKRELLPMLADLSRLSGRAEENSCIWHPRDNRILVHRYIYELDDEEVVIIKLKYSARMFNLYLTPIDVDDQI